MLLRQRFLHYLFGISVLSFLLMPSICYLRAMLFSLFLPRSRIYYPKSLCGLFFPFPTVCGTRLHCCRGSTSSLSSLVDSHRIAPQAHAVSFGFFFVFFLQAETDIHLIVVLSGDTTHTVSHKRRTETGFIVSAHKLPSITLLTLKATL